MKRTPSVSLLFILAITATHRLTFKIINVLSDVYLSLMMTWGKDVYCAGKDKASFIPSTMIRLAGYLALAMANEMYKREKRKYLFKYSGDQGFQP